MNSTEKNLSDNNPPVFSSWSHLYAIVLILHTLIIALFYWFTQSHS